MRQPTWVEANEEFHDLIVEAAGNVICAAYSPISTPASCAPSCWPPLRSDGSWMRENVAQHEAIHAAIVRHDAAEARRQMTHHVKRSGELMVRWLEAKVGSDAG